MKRMENKWILIPQNTEKTIFKGVLHVNEYDFLFELIMDHGKDLIESCCSFNCDWNLKDLLKGYEHCLKERLRQSKNADEFLSEIYSVATKLQNTKNRRVKGFLTTPNVGYQSNIIKEIESIGWEKLSNLDPTFSSLTLSARDVASREHLLHLKFNIEDPTKTPLCQADLPIAFNPRCLSQCGSIKKIYEQFLEELNRHQDVWDTLDQFDQKCWVLEPETRSRSCCYRRIAIGNRSSLLVNVNPLQPRTLPECRFLGADETVAPLIEKWNHGLYSWDQSKTVLNNLEAVLEINFPSPITASKENFSMDCCICYAYKLNDEVPEIACADSRCGQLFHSTCLKEWIRSLPNFRQSFNVLFGECPYCSTPLTVKMCQKSQTVTKT